MHSIVGQTLQDGKYSLEQELGQSGFGVIFKATDNYLGKQVVIKTLNESLQRHPDFAQFQNQFQHEGRRLALCRHPNIVRVNDFFVEAGLPYMVMEHIPGQTLQTVVFPGKPLEETTAIHYIRQIGEALKVVHQRGLLHRNIKPENIILRTPPTPPYLHEVSLRKIRGGEVVLIDFDLARKFTPNVTKVRTGIVSDGYTPLEEYLTKAKGTTVSDVYGLAATLYAILTAQVPTPAVLRDCQPMPPPRDLRPQLSAAVNQAVMRGMAVEARFRPTTVDEWLSLLPVTQFEQANVRVTGSIPTQTTPTIALTPQNVSQTQKQSQTAIIAPMSHRFRIIVVLMGIAVAIATGLVILNKINSSSKNQQTPTPTESPIDPTESPIDSSSENQQAPSSKKSPIDSSSEKQPVPSPKKSPIDSSSENQQAPPPKKSQGDDLQRKNPEEPAAPPEAPKPVEKSRPSQPVQKPIRQSLPRESSPPVKSSPSTVEPSRSPTPVQSPSSPIGNPELPSVESKQTPESAPDASQIPESKPTLSPAPKTLELMKEPTTQSVPLEGPQKKKPQPDQAEGEQN